MTIKEERSIWNKAVRCAADEILKFDGIIPDKIERQYVCDKIKEKWLYKREVGIREFKKQKNTNT